MIARDRVDMHTHQGLQFNFYILCFEQLRAAISSIYIMRAWQLAWLPTCLSSSIHGAWITLAYGFPNTKIILHWWGSFNTKIILLSNSCGHPTMERPKNQIRLNNTIHYRSKRVQQPPIIYKANENYQDLSSIISLNCLRE